MASSAQHDIRTCVCSACCQERAKIPPPNATWVWMKILGISVGLILGVLVIANVLFYQVAVTIDAIPAFAALALWLSPLWLPGLLFFAGLYFFIRFIKWSWYRDK